MLQGVVNYGTGRAIRDMGITGPVAGKTGTTNSGEDVWFVGYTPTLVAGIWFGYDTPRKIAYNASGGRLAAPAWAEIYQAGWREPKGSAFTVPLGMVRPWSIRRAASWRRSGVRAARSSGSSRAGSRRRRVTCTPVRRRARSRSTRTATSRLSAMIRSARSVAASGVSCGRSFTGRRTVSPSVARDWTMSAATASGEAVLAHRLDPSLRSGCPPLRHVTYVLPIPAWSTLSPEAE